MRLAFLFTLFIGLLTGVSFKPADGGLNCLGFHEGTFTYKSPEGTVKVVIEGNHHTEFHHKGKYTIESTIEWLSDCEYKATLIKTNLPDFPFKPGVILFVRVYKIEGKKYFYKSTLNGESIDGVLTKVK